MMHTNSSDSITSYQGLILACHLHFELGSSHLYLVHGLLPAHLHLECISEKAFFFLFFFRCFLSKVTPIRFFIRFLVHQITIMIVLAKSVRGKIIFIDLFIKFVKVLEKGIWCSSIVVRLEVICLEFDGLIVGC